MVRERRLTLGRIQQRVLHRVLACHRRASCRDNPILSSSHRCTFPALCPGLPPLVHLQAFSEVMRNGHTFTMATGALRSHPSPASAHPARLTASSLSHSPGPVLAPLPSLTARCHSQTVVPSLTPTAPNTRQGAPEPGWPHWSCRGNLWA